MKAPLWEPEDSLHIAQVARRLIVARTDRGIGADGRTFAPLDDGQATDLRRTGRMLGSLDVVRTRQGAAVEAGVEYARYVDAKRPFMGLTEGDLAELDAEVERRLEARERAWSER